MSVAKFDTSNLIKYREHMSCRLKHVRAISFTNDIWTSDVCHMYLLLTGWTQYRLQPFGFLSVGFQSNKFCE